MMKLLEGCHSSYPWRQLLWLCLSMEQRPTERSSNVDTEYSNGRPGTEEATSAVKPVVATTTVKPGKSSRSCISLVLLLLMRVAILGTTATIGLLLVSLVGYHYHYTANGSLSTPSFSTSLQHLLSTRIVVDDSHCLHKQSTLSLRSMTSRMHHSLASHSSRSSSSTSNSSCPASTVSDVNSDQQYNFSATLSSVHANRATQTTSLETVYIPGGGFSGFWYHLGYFASSLFSHNAYHSLTTETLNTSTTTTTTTANTMPTQYYCYSSGCLAIVLAGLLPNGVLDVYKAAQSAQSSWLDGTLPQYEVVNDFLHRLLLTDSAAHSNGTRSSSSSTSHTHATRHFVTHILPHLHIWVTDVEYEQHDDDSNTNQSHNEATATLHSENNTTMPKPGRQQQPQPQKSSQVLRIVPRAHQATNLDELVTLLQQTTYIPWVTGPMPFFKPTASTFATRSTKSVVVIDGGFGRWWHTPCTRTVSIPLTLATLLQAFNPGLSADTAMDLYHLGVRQATDNVAV